MRKVDESDDAVDKRVSKGDECVERTHLEADENQVDEPTRRCDDVDDDPEQQARTNHHTDGGVDPFTAPNGEASFGRFNRGRSHRVTRGSNIASGYATKLFLAVL